MANVKLLFLGSGRIGKTCLLISHTTNAFPHEYVPTVFDNYGYNIDVDGENVFVGLWDTAGGEDYARVRPLSYPQTSCFVLGFDVTREATLDRLRDEFVPEIKHHCPGTPWILVGLKSDLRDSVEAAQERKRDPVDKSTALTFAKNSGAQEYHECSALTREGVANVFDRAIRIGLQGQSNATTRQK
eukprot:TRINITY_DN2355_c0_g1_i2.p1 TRINITY_DN2355_c0_g1~~TRINITY_DN2355_c0_g1_i2.p1  ORF type:complete len:186 (+),score=23.87 TRINITY_DN2355_c0_g1_i2:48-605(+)